MPKEDVHPEEFVLCNTSNQTNVTLLPIVNRISGNTATAEDIEEIKKFVSNRLLERYITPFPEEYKTGETEQYGFLIVASMCLLIATIQAFKEGQNGFYELKKDDVVESKNETEAFVNFLTTYQAVFNISPEQAEDFYKNVRCGILHQGETKNGWRIKPIDGEKPVCWETKTIDSIAFLKKMRIVLENYTESLNDKENLKTCAKKIDFIIKNCTRELKQSKN